MRGQSRKRQIQKKSLREEERFINAKKTSHPEELAKLKKEIPVVFQVLAMFFGFAGHGACHNCKRIGKILKLTKNEAHALKWRGLQLLGWEVEGDYFERKTEAILLKLSNRQQQEGENKMSNFDTIITILRDKVLNDKGFSKFAVDMDIFLESEEGQPKYYFHPVLRQIVERGKNTPTEVCEGLNPLEITTRQVVETTEILFCFADSQKVDQTPVSSVHKYELLKKAYEAQKQSTEAVPEEEEAESKTKYYVLVEMEDAIKDGLLKLTPKQLDFSQSFVIQLGDDSVIEEEFLVDPLPSLEGNVSDLKKIQANLPDGVRFIFLGSQGDNVPDIFCLLKKNN